VILVAENVIGCLLTFDGVGGRIVEAEAYHHEDPASHSFVGKRPRNATMFGPVGRAYVYRSYGVHWCLNFVAGEEPGSAVLIRAIEPTEGIALMEERRGLSSPRLLCSGPGRLTEALGITGQHDGLALDRPPFELRLPEEKPAVVVGRRIGLTRAIETPWRFGLEGSRYLSRPFREGT
jgi:DNA-3-methyladenine glycosylase